MKWSKGYIYTLKEDPADAEIVSHKLMIRSGFIKKVAQGIYTYGPLALKAIRKFEHIIREELNKRGCLEILMPMVQPASLWQETGRWDEMGAALLKFKNRTGQEWCLGATHEEVVTDYVRGTVKSYRDLPLNLYQIQTKYRDEIRPRFGLLRGREFIMKDAYSFDVSAEKAYESYQKMFEAYSAIFSRLGVDFRAVEADSGNIGGKRSQEFHILAESGEDVLLVSTESDFAANREICPVLPPSEKGKKREALESVGEFETPHVKSIEDLAHFVKKSPKELVKTLFFSTENGAVAVLVRGSDEVNPFKIKTHLGLSQVPELLSDEEVRDICGAGPGSCGPVGLDIPVLMDQFVDPLENYIVGANKDGFHLRNVNHPRDYTPSFVGDFRFAVEGDPSPDGKGYLKAMRGIEVGHIFYLGKKYSEPMGATFLDDQGKRQFIEMGCYGIGVSRTIQAVIEQNHDKDGMIWPVSIAPYHVHICLLDPDKPEALSVAELLYDELQQRGIEVLLDDRKERPGVKFKDADLLGMPFRVTVGHRGLEEGKLEVRSRKTGQTDFIPVDQVSEYLEERIRVAL